MTSQIEEIQNQQAQSSVLDPCPYVNCNFIFGSAAKVERLWSMGKQILRYDRSSMTPLVFETMLFLKVNRHYWDQAMVIEAMRKAESDCLAKNLVDNTLQQSILDENYTSDSDSDK
jgi:hypothetical protein